MGRGRSSWVWSALVAGIAIMGCSDDPGASKDSSYQQVECEDLDGDEYGEGPGCLGSDCDDEDPDHWSDCGSCVDRDEDGRGHECDLGPDCGPSDPAHWSDCDTCQDEDGDDRGTECDLGDDCSEDDPDNWVSCDSCADDDGDARFGGCDAYSTRPGPDCDDADPDNWHACETCHDQDGDTYFGECDLYTTFEGPDCDDADPDNWISCDSCVDNDGDGHRINCDSYDTTSEDCDDSDELHWSDCGACSDSDNDGRGNGCDLGSDCNDGDPNNWTSCSTCLDGDSDGWFVNCDDYVTRSGPDCNDASPINWSDCGSCIDQDGDTFGQGCDQGDDCNDQDATVNPNGTDPTIDGEDQDCNGFDGSALFDDFDTGDFGAGVWASTIGDLQVTSSGSYSGFYSLNLGDGGATATTVAVDMAACGSIFWSYQGQRGPNAPDASDFLTLQYFDGGSWITADSWAGNGSSDWGFSLRSGTISASAATHAASQLRLVSSTDTGTDDFYVDDFTFGCGNDADGDGYPGASDCDDSDPQLWSSCDTCQDADRDGFWADCDTYVVVNGPDCDDLDPNNWYSCTSCEDNDGDTHYVDCDAYNTIQGPDCGDSDENNWLSCGTCDDQDGDGFFTNCDTYESIDGPDCNDADSIHWFDCGICVDDDGDLFGLDCDLGEDCATGDPSHWDDCGTCTDGDGDDYGVGCNLGDDCDDTDAGIFPGVSDTVLDGVDRNCDGYDASLIFDNFDTGNIDGSVWESVTGDFEYNSFYSDSGAYSLLLGGGGGEARSLPFDTSTCSLLAWQYDGKRGPESPDSSDNLTLEYYNGTIWQSFNVWIGNGSDDASFSSRNGILSAPDAYHGAFQLRLVSYGSGSGSDDFYVDNLFVGCAFDADGDGAASTSDCDDADPDVWVSCGACVDADGDGNFVGCDAFVNRPGPDCNDADPDNWLSCATCLDADSDSSYAGCDAYGALAGPDCAPSDAAHWSDCGVCSDGDGDDYGTGCDLGSDCDPTSAAHWLDCGTCTDGDGDEYGTGCDLGADCDDADPGINPAATDAAVNGIDEDCDHLDGPILADDFENGLGPDWESIVGDGGVTSLFAAAGTSSLHLGGDGSGWVNTITLDTSMCDLIEWSYKGKRGPEAPDSSNGLQLKYTINGSVYTIADHWSGNNSVDPAFVFRSGIIDEPNAFGAEFQVQLLANVFGVGIDDFYVDDFQVGCLLDSDADGVADRDDCEETDPNHWADCGNCVDGDGDDYGTSCDLGDDCDDTDGGIHPGAVDSVGDGIDQNCSGYDGPWVWIDDFEDGDYAGWFEENPGFSVEPSAAANGTTQGLTMTGGGNGHYQGLYATFSGLQPNNISYWANSGSTSTADTYFIISGAGSKYNEAGGVFFRDSGQIWLFGSGGIQVMPYTANTWYHIEFKNIDWTAHTFDLHIDGVPQVTGFAFEDPISSMDRIDLYNFESATTRWDEIYIN